MPKVGRFLQSDVTRALKGALAAGIEVARCEIETDGRIVIIPRPPGEMIGDNATDREIGDRIIASLFNDPPKSRGALEPQEKWRKKHAASTSYPFFDADDLAELLSKPMSKMEQAALAGIAHCGPDGAKASDVKWAGFRTSRKLAARDMVTLEVRGGHDWVIPTALGMKEVAERPFRGSPRGEGAKE